MGTRALKGSDLSLIHIYLDLGRSTKFSNVMIKSTILGFKMAGNLNQTIWNLQIIIVPKITNIKGSWDLPLSVLMFTQL